MRPIIAFAVVFTLAACNTVAGVGDDISGAARSVQSWAR